MKEKLGFYILSLYVNKFLDKLERAFEIEPVDLIKVYHKEAETCIKRTEYAEAIDLCQKAIKLDHKDAEAYYITAYN